MLMLEENIWSQDQGSKELRLYEEPREPDLRGLQKAMAWAHPPKTDLQRNKGILGCPGKHPVETELFVTLPQSSLADRSFVPRPTRPA